MGKPTAFMEVPREVPPKRPVAERIHDHRELHLPLAGQALTSQASRCMDCGVPFCHDACPLGNLIPEWNDLVYRGRTEEATQRLFHTNNFPEITGRLCPAPCEAACVLAIDGAPVTIKEVERALGDHALASGGLTPRPAETKTGHRVAVIGSGPAGLACAQELARAGHDVTVFEQADRIGGLLRYGIPDFKMEKHLIDRRLEQMREEGVKFVTNAHVGHNVPVEDLRKVYDAILLAG